MMNKFNKLSYTMLMLLPVLTGCTVGPDYHEPASPVKATKYARLPDTSFATSPTTSAWWTTLNAPLLNQLIDDALKNNPDIGIVRARLRQARATLSGNKASEYPSLSASGAAVRAHLPDSVATGDTNPLSLYTTSFDASWEVDLFGGTRRAIEASRAMEQASVANIADAQVSITAEVARNYLMLAGARQQLALLKRSVEVQQQMLALTQQRRHQGTASDSDVERLVTQLETTQSQLSPLQADIDGYLDTLAFLVGKTPGELDGMLSNINSLPQLPSDINVSDPGSLLKRRPDVRSAERQLAAKTAEIGEHKADYFPKINLVGTLGFSTAEGALLEKQNMSWMLIPFLQWNFLDFGRVGAQVDKAQAERDEAEAQWRKTVLDALRDANSSLSRYGHQRQNVVDLYRVSASAQHASSLVQQRYKAGAASLIDYLDSERTLMAAQQDEINAQTQLTVDFVALQKSLGLGWQ